jgi:hypothetical protein
VAGNGAAAVSDSEIQRDVCPFECCVYGNWAALTNIPVRAGEGDAHAVAFTLAAGDTFTARTGNVHLQPPGRVVITKEISTDAGDSIELQPGDTIDVLNYEGEGHYRIRHRGRSVTSKAFWAAPGERYSQYGDEHIAGTLLRAPVATWWVEVLDRQNRTGWIRMDSTVRVGGADACGQ